MASMLSLVTHLPKFSLYRGRVRSSQVCVDVDNLPWDPSERPNILNYDPNQRDEIRRKYWLRGPCQPRGHIFPTKKIGSKLRRFVTTWFDEFRWVEYSVKTDKAYCLCCYLFRDENPHFGGDAFVSNGFNNWAKKERLYLHVGEVNSFHNRAQRKCETLVQQKQSIVVAFHKQTEKEKIEYRMRLKASIDCCRLLLKFGLPFRGHDESEISLNQGLFRGMLEFLGDANETVRKVILDNAPRNCQLTSPKIQKDVANCFLEEVLKLIVEEIGNDVFALLVDESSDISKKEQMAVVLRYVDARGSIKERFVGLLHVKETSSETLKNMAALSPRASFSMFKKESLVKLCEFYPYDFDDMERVNISGELDLYYHYVHQHERFANLNGIDELAIAMVETNKHLTYPLVYRLLKLVLTLPVATASVERCFSTMKLVKSYLRNRMGDEFLNAAVACAVEKETLRNVKDDDVINRFQNMRIRREQL